MILLFYIVLNLIVIYIFTKIKKKLHILEIIFYWLIASYLFQNFSALCYMNFKTLIIPDKLTYEFSHFINRTILYPIIMVTFLHCFQVASHFSKKLLLIISFTLLLGGIEWVEHITGVLIHVHWHIWWSLSYWFVTLTVMIGFLKFFRKFLYKGG